MVYLGERVYFYSVSVYMEVMVIKSAVEPRRPGEGPVAMHVEVGEDGGTRGETSEIGGSSDSESISSAKASLSLHHPTASPFSAPPLPSCRRSRSRRPSYWRGCNGLRNAVVCVDGRNVPVPVLGVVQLQSALELHLRHFIRLARLFHLLRPGKAPAKALVRDLPLC